MASLVYLTTRIPSSLANEVTLAGHQVFETEAGSEALYLCEHEHVDVIVIAPDIDDPNIAQAQLHFMTIKLKPEATAKELIWQLSHLFPDRLTTVQ